jgi:hypothetical protein
MYILVTYKGFLEVSHLSNILLLSWQRWRRGVAGSGGSRGMFECCRSVSTGNILGLVVSTGKCLVFVEIHNTSFVSISYLQWQLCLSSSICQISHIRLKLFYCI